MKLVAIVGTNAETSYDRELLHYMQRHFSKSVTMTVAEINQVPQFNAPHEKDELPTAVKRLATKIEAADGVVISVPEDEKVVPVALKDTIEWLSSTIHPLIGKKIMIVGTSLGVKESNSVQDKLREALIAPGVEANVLPGNEFLLSFVDNAFDGQGNLIDAPTVNALDSSFDNYLKFINNNSETPALNVKWDGNYDVIVLGFGGAGASAARFAADQGAHVLVVEAAPYGREGGNTRYSAQHVVMGKDSNELTEYYKALGYPYTYPEKTLEAYIKGMSHIPMYFEKYLGIKAVSWKYDIKPSDPVANKKTMAEYPELPGSDTVDFALVHRRDADAGLWKILRQQVMDRTDMIDIWLNSRAAKLIQEPVTGVVRGVQINREDKLLNIHAKNGVVLAMGGFENNPELVQTYLHSKRLTPLGTLYNRGDGIKMAQEVGAKMWHMSTYESHGVLPGLTFKEAEDERGRQLNWPLLKKGSILVTADDGTRYFPEDSPHRHGHIQTHGSWLIPQKNLHPYLVFDQAQYDEFEKQLTDNGQLPYPEFMEKLISAKTLAELAGQMDVPAGNLEKTIANFNQFKEAGEDYAFGRHPESMRSFDDGPYYAIAMANDVLNTQGGPQRNEKAEILDTNSNPIPHLYGAGELGGVIANNYQGGGNLTECLVFGKLAGESAATAKEDADEVNATDANGINDIVDTESAAKVTLGDNQYLGSSNSGLGGKITVRVTYQKNKIEDVEVMQHHESEDVGLVAVDEMPKEIVAANSTDVDVVAGASASSRAIKEAVQDAITQAE
ncbi:FAD-binding protein [Companilactobacillus ginsenosidimutans]|uniref:Urocanate reductase n=1 Tax=Companilactobacillus ginsenosidimutans TaxID=1007676 RepID=A0A0H4QLM0_9LACO|nr:FAD-binding protein [Companilactobacillus ginsenosidimutans]AKP67986.1 fumarate reductase [Companilactobacillus ginsenosidimutans]